MRKSDSKQCQGVVQIIQYLKEKLETNSGERNRNGSMKTMKRQKE